MRMTMIHGGIYLLRVLCILFVVITGQFSLHDQFVLTIVAMVNIYVSISAPINGFWMHHIDGDSGCFAKHNVYVQPTTVKLENIVRLVGEELMFPATEYVYISVNIYQYITNNDALSMHRRHALDQTEWVVNNINAFHDDINQLREIYVDEDSDLENNNAQNNNGPRELRLEEMDIVRNVVLIDHRNAHAMEVDNTVDNSDINDIEEKGSQILHRTQNNESVLPYLPNIDRFDDNNDNQYERTPPPNFRIGLDELLSAD
eukprot:762094_1